MALSINDSQHNNTLPLCWVSLFWVLHLIYYLLCWMSLGWVSRRQSKSIARMAVNDILAYNSPELVSTLKKFYSTGQDFNPPIILIIFASPQNMDWHSEITGERIGLCWVIWQNSGCLCYKFFQVYLILQHCKLACVSLVAIFTFSLMFKPTLMETPLQGVSSLRCLQILS